MTTLISIMGHADAKDTFERHLPYWREHERERATLLFFFPADAAFTVPGYPTIALGRKEHDGIHAIARFYSIIKHMADTGGYDRYCFMEYDSFCLGPLPQVPAGGVIGNRFKDSSPTWTGTQFVHPPIFIDGSVMPRLVKMMEHTSFELEAGMWDRWFGLVLDRTSIQCESFLENGTGYSRNTIHEADFLGLRKAIIDGARFIHGVKDKATLEVVQLAWHLAQAKHELLEAGDVL